MNAQPLTRRTPPYATLLLLALMLPAALACVVPVATRTETRYVLTQQARLPAPTGPDSVGKMTEEGAVSLQGSVQATQVNTADSGDENSQRASLGHLIHDKSIQARLGFGLGERLELSMSGRYSQATWTTATSDVTPDRAPSNGKDHKFYGGLQTRALIGGSRDNGIAFLLEGSLGTAQVRRTTETTITTTIVHADGSETRLPPVTTTSEEATDAFFWTTRAGLQAFLTPIPGLTLQGGVLAQNYPRYWARRVVGTTCEDDLFDTLPASCNGDTPEDLETHNMLIVGTLFAGASLAFDELPLSLHAQLYANTLSPELIRTAIPYGGELAVRLTFGQ